MAVEYSLKIKKSAKDIILQTLEDYGFATCDLSWPDEEIKEPASREWPGQSGEDVYFPSQLFLKPFDLTVKFCYKGPLNTALDSYNKFRGMLLGEDGTGTQMEIYDPYWNRGYSRVHLKQMGNLSFKKSNIDEVSCFKAVFRITDPLSRAKL